MRAFTPLIASSLAGLAYAQQTSSFPNETGVRSLFIPFKTLEGTPVASIASNHSAVTVYVISCPTASPDCAIAPNLTVTEGPSSVGYTSYAANSGGSAVLGCDLDGTTSAVCSNAAHANGGVSKTTENIGASDIHYQAISITATQNITTGAPAETVIISNNHTTTVHPNKTASMTVTSSVRLTSSSSPGAAAPTAVGAQWAMGGALGAGILALAAL